MEVVEVAKLVEEEEEGKTTGTGVGRLVCVVYFPLFVKVKVKVTRSRRFFIISPRVLKFFMKHSTYIWTKIGGEQNWFQKINFFSISYCIRKMRKNGKFQPKIRLPVFLAHK